MSVEILQHYVKIAVINKHVHCVKTIVNIVLLNVFQKLGQKKFTRKKMASSLLV